MWQITLLELKVLLYTMHNNYSNPSVFFPPFQISTASNYTFMLLHGFYDQLLKIFTCFDRPVSKNHKH